MADLNRGTQAVGRIDVVFDDEHLFRCSISVGTLLGCYGRSWRRAKRKRYRECRTLVGTGTLAAYGAAVQFDQALDQSQPESKSSLGSIERRFPLREGFENMWQHLWWDGTTCILYTHDRLLSRGIDLDGDG